MNSKADIIKVLLQKNLNLKSQNLFLYNKRLVHQFKINKRKIEINFKNKIIIVRSSALDEDGDLESVCWQIFVYSRS